jgi:conjugal transfer pilus assembly protein TraK
MMPYSARQRLTAAILAAAIQSFASPAMADQFKQSADGGSIDCAVSARELTRFSLIADQFASVSKISSGVPYNDFAVSNEPLRGDVYVSVPETFAGTRISFFATSRKGYVYKFACTVEKIEAAQVFVSNPALSKSDASQWEKQGSPEAAAVRLIQAMAGQQTIDGFELHQPAIMPSRVGVLEVQLIAEYQGAALAGKALRLANRGTKALTLSALDLAPKDTLAVAIAEPRLEPGASTTAYLVGPNGAQSND